MTMEWDARLPRDEDRAEEPDHGAKDLTLMEGIQGGDRTSLQLLMNRYRAPLAAYAAARTVCREDAQDVVPETFVRVWRHREKWNHSGP